MTQFWRHNSLLLAVIFLFPQVVNALDLNECRQLIIRGEYENCIKETTAQIEEGAFGESWPCLKAEAQMSLGHYEEALRTVKQGLGAYPWSIRLRILEIELNPYVGNPSRLPMIRQEISSLVRSSPWRFTDVENLVALGQFVLREGTDAKSVQDVFFQRARQQDPQHRVPQLAIGNLALEKRDFALASDIFRPGMEQFPDDPDFMLGYARSIQSQNRKESLEIVLDATKVNSRHTPALLFLAEEYIAIEDYDQAESILLTILSYHGRNPSALALQSAISTLRGDKEGATRHRQQALSDWDQNPLVDHTIGRILSSKYRFQEGATAQLQALEFAPEYLPAKKQRAWDLLRLGQEDEGWQLVEETYQQDQYDVSSYNLVTLRGELERFTTLEKDGIKLRMDPREARIYGPHVLDLLLEARKELAQKYQVNLNQDVIVEIYPKPSDFAVRTFGLPFGGGYLGVCFGDVITAKSPASQTTQPVNWQAVLWHEFAHTVTLKKTHNRMPRWLSEGISVYEERQRNPSWGEQMNHRYREKIMMGNHPPISSISQSFMTGEGDLLFAYFHSAAVVEYLIDQYGFDVLLAVLDDLAVGMNVNEALERHTLPMRQLDEEFRKHWKAIASIHGWGVDWTTADLEPLLSQPDAADQLIRWAADHPRNYLGLKTCAELLIKLNRAAEATRILESAVELFPDEIGLESGLAQLANIRRQTGETEAEYETLRKLVKIDDDAAPAFRRLIEIDVKREDWKNASAHARQLLAIRPLSPQTYLALAEASENLADPLQAVSSLQSALEFELSNSADLRYRLAVQFQKLERNEEAKRQVLQSLEQAPRSRDSLRLLLELTDH